MIANQLIIPLKFKSSRFFPSKPSIDSTGNSTQPGDFAKGMTVRPEGSIMANHLFHIGALGFGGTGHLVPMRG